VVSKTALLPLVRSFDWKAVAASLQERPALVAHRDERGRNWLHICCATALKGRNAAPSIRTADVLLARGIDLGRNLRLKKSSDYEHVALLARHKARFDLPDKQGATAAEIMSRKRDPRRPRRPPHTNHRSPRSP
jgi:hypothetical protein